MIFRVDIRKSKRGKIVESFWTDNFNIETRPNMFVNVYQKF